MPTTLMPATIGLDAGTGAVTGSCAANAPVLYRWRTPSMTVSQTSTTGAGGEFAFSVASLGLPTPAGTIIEARCENGQGNVQVVSLVAP